MKKKYSGAEELQAKKLLAFFLISCKKKKKKSGGGEGVMLVPMFIDRRGWSNGVPLRCWIVPELLREEG